MVAQLRAHACSDGAQSQRFGGVEFDQLAVEVERRVRAALVPAGHLGDLLGVVVAGVTDPTGIPLRCFPAIQCCTSPMPTSRSPGPIKEGNA